MSVALKLRGADRVRSSRSAYRGALWHMRLVPVRPWYALFRSTSRRIERTMGGERSYTPCSRLRGHRRYSQPILYGGA